MPKPIKFYYDFLSQPCRALYMFLEASKIPYESHPVALQNGEHLTEAFKRNVNRFQQVPAINDNGFKLSESIAIFRYLAREKLVPYHWYPKESQSQAKIDEYLEWQHSNTRLACTAYFRTMYNLMANGDEKPDKEKIEEVKIFLDKTLDNLENNWIIRPNHFLVGDKITIADLLAACEVEQTRVTGYNPAQGRPKIGKWLKSVQYAMDPYYSDAHDVLNKYANSLVNNRKKENVAKI